MPKKQPPGVKVHARQIEMVALADLKPYERNARTHDEAQIAALAKVIADSGFTAPLLLEPDGTIIAGHGRLEAARQLGMLEVPAVRVSGLTPAQITALRLSDNSIGLRSAWDEDLLRSELQGLDALGFDLDLTGFEAGELAGIFAEKVGKTDPDDAPEPQAEAVSALGDIWLMGNHRLVCGDCTDAETVVKLMRGERAVLFATDPPYAVGYSGGSHPPTRGNGGLKGSEKRDKDWSDSYHEAGPQDDGRPFYLAFCKVAVEHAIKPDAAWYCWHAATRQAMVEGVWNECGAFMHQQIVWVKSRPVLTYSAFMWQHEPCLMGWVRGAKPETKTRGWTKFHTTVWTVDNAEIESSDHPTSKPVALFAPPMEAHTQPGDVVYEPFSGSGTQIIAAEMTARVCFACEISPQFVDVAARRWQAFTGREATLEATGQTFAEVERERLGEFVEEAVA